MGAMIGRDGRPQRRSWADPRGAIRYVRNAPLWLKCTLFLLILSGGGSALYLLTERQAQKRAHRAAVEGWTRYNDAVRARDTERMIAALDAILALNPNDARAKTFRATLTSGVAADNPEMARVTLRQAFRTNDFAAIQREANTLLASEPKDWFGHCAKAYAALGRGDEAAAQSALDQLPDPFSANGPDLGGLALGFDLFRRTGRDVAPLRAFVQRNVTRIVRAPTTLSLPPESRLVVVESYLSGFEPDRSQPQPTELLEAFSAARNLVTTAAADATSDSAAPAVLILARVGRLGGAFLEITGLFLTHEQITPEQAADFRTDDLDRTQKAWEAVLEGEPKNAEAFCGLAVVQSRRGDNRAARDTVARGLTVCGEHPQLAELFSRVLQAEGRSLDAFQALQGSARTHPEEPIWWRLAADAAVAANRRDLALEAIHEYQAKKPDELWATRAEAKLLLDGGDAAGAAARLAPLSIGKLAGDPLLTQVYAQATATLKQSAELEALLAAATTRATEMKSSAPIAAALKGLMNAPADPARLAEIPTRLQSALAEFEADSALLELDALVKFRVAEAENWASNPANAAIRAAERFRAKSPEDRANAARLVTLRLYAENAPERAAREVAPLAAAETAPDVSAEELELLGHTYRRVGRLPEAVRVLTHATKLYPVPAGVFTQLALAQHASGAKPEAKATLARAQALPRTPREQADYAAAATVLYRENPTP